MLSLYCILSRASRALAGILFTTILLFCAIAAKGQVSFGLKAGINGNSIGKPDDPVLETRVMWSYHVGVFSRLEFSDQFYFLPEVQFIEKGYWMRGIVFHKGAKFKNKYLEVPVMVAFSPTETLSFEVGPTVGFNVGKTRIVTPTARSTADYNYESVDFGFTGGLKVELGKRLSLAARYYYGLTRVFRVRLHYEFEDPLFWNHEDLEVYNRNVHLSMYYVVW